MLQTIFRTLILYVTVLIVMRIMGKREIGQISPFDFVVAIIIAELAAIPMEGHHIPIWEGIIPIITLLVAEVTLSLIGLKSRIARKIIDGSPSILIENGQILRKELRRQRYSLDDLLVQLREGGYPNVADVEFAILETSGKLTIIPRSQKRPLTAQDLHLDTIDDGIPIELIMDGKIIKENLIKINLDQKWLQKQLAKAGIEKETDVFYANLDAQGRLFLSPKNKTKGP